MKTKIKNGINGKVNPYWVGHAFTDVNSTPVSTVSQENCCYLPWVKFRGRFIFDMRKSCGDILGTFNISLLKPNRQTKSKARKKIQVFQNLDISNSELLLKSEFLERR